MKKEMFYDAGPLIFQLAKELRNNPTPAEDILWMHLRTKPFGYKFRRQHPAGNYIVDFYSHALKLAIEADGSIHNDPEVMQADIERQKNLEAHGIQFIRFTNEEIIHHLDKVIEEISVVIMKVTPHPQPLKGSGSAQHPLENSIK
ncbi:MAG: endonuclease domain-containing protein [Chitinophagaceae bacterium]